MLVHKVETPQSTDNARKQDFDLSLSDKTILIEQLATTIERLEAIKPYANTMLSAVFGPPLCGAGETPKPWVGMDRTLITSLARGLNCFCKRKIERVIREGGDKQSDRISQLEREKCFRQVSLAQLLPDSGNGFLSIMSDKIFFALGYGKCQILPIGQGIKVKGASGGTLRVLGRCKDLPIYLGGGRIILISPCIITGLAGAEVILSPGTLQHLDAQHIYKSHTMEFLKLPLSVKLFGAPIIAKWLRLHREAGRNQVVPLSPGKKSQTNLISGYVSTNDYFSRGGSRVGGARETALWSQTDLQKQLLQLELQMTTGATVNAIQIDQECTRDFNKENGVDNCDENGPRCLFHTAEVSTGVTYRGHCKLDKDRNKCSPKQMAAQFDRMCGSTCDNAPLQKEDDSASEATEAEVAAAGSADKKKKPKWRRVRGQRKVTCPREGCNWSDDLTRLGAKTRHKLEQSHKQCVLSVTQDKTYISVGQRAVTLLPGMSSKVPCKVTKADLLEGRNILIELLEEATSKNNIRMYDSVDSVADGKVTLIVENLSEKTITLQPKEKIAEATLILSQEETTHNLESIGEFAAAPPCSAHEIYASKDKHDQEVFVNRLDATKRREMSDPAMASFEKTDASYGPEPEEQSEKPWPDTAKWGDVPDTDTWSTQEKKEWLRFQFNLDDNPTIETEPGAREDLEDFMVKHFKAFAITKGDFGRTELMKFSIKLQDPEVKPHRAKGRMINPTAENVLREQMMLWDKTGIIRPSESAWAAGLLGVAKKGGGTRWCADFRMVNKATLADSFPLPNIKSNLDKLGGSKIFSAIDALGAYHSMEIEEGDKHLTAFLTPWGLFEYNRLPFGLQNAVAAYSRLVERALAPCSKDQVLPYLDDVLVHTKTVKEHVQALKQVIECHAQAGLKIHPEKSELFKKKVMYLGHEISEHGLALPGESIEIIKNWVRPTTSKDVRSFCGRAGYHREFIPGFAKLVAPLEEIRNIDKRIFNWTPQHQEAFESIKEAYTKAGDEGPMAFPDFSQEAKPIVLDTDWSKQAISCELGQEQEGRMRLLACAGRKNCSYERNYYSVKGELKSFVFALDRWHHLLSFRPFIWRTDARSLLYLEQMKTGNQGIFWRWYEKIANYRFSIEHRPGKDHQNVDLISRTENLRDPTEEEIEEDEPTLTWQIGARCMPIRLGGEEERDSSTGESSSEEDSDGEMDPGQIMKECPNTGVLDCQKCGAISPETGEAIRDDAHRGLESGDRKKDRGLRVSFSPKVKARWFFKQTKDIDPGPIVRGRGQLKGWSDEYSVPLKDQPERKLSSVGHKRKGGTDLEMGEPLDTRPIPLIRVWEMDVMSGEEECKGCPRIRTFDDKTLEEIQEQESVESAYQPMIDNITKEGLQGMDEIGQDIAITIEEDGKSPKVIRRTTDSLRGQLEHEGVSKFLAPIDMVAEQDADELLSRVKSWIRGGSKPTRAEAVPLGSEGSRYRDIYETLFIDGDGVLKMKSADQILYSVEGSPEEESAKRAKAQWNARTCLPYALRNKAWNWFHLAIVGGCHAKAGKSILKFKEIFYMPDLIAFTTEMIAACHTCIQMDRSPRKNKGMFIDRESGAFNEKLVIDICGPFARPDLSGARYILTMLDNFTRYLTVKPLLDKKAATIAEAFLEAWYFIHGPPRQIHMDNAKEFHGVEFKDLLRLLGVRQTFAPTYNPRSVRVERAHRTLNSLIRGACENHDGDWRGVLYAAVFTYNLTAHASTGLSPYVALHGRRPHVPADVVFGTFPEGSFKNVAASAANIRSRLHATSRYAQENLSSYIQKTTGNYNGYFPTFSIPPGTLVWYHSPYIAPGDRVKKFRFAYTGPWVVVKQISSVLFVLAATQEVGGHNQKFLVTKDNLRLYIPEHSNVKWKELDVSLFSDEELSPQNSGTARVRMKFRLPSGGNAPDWGETQDLGASGANWSQAMDESIMAGESRKPLHTDRPAEPPTLMSPMERAQPDRPIQSDGDTAAPAEPTIRVYTPSNPPERVSLATLPGEQSSTTRVLRPRSKPVNYSEIETISAVMRPGKFKCETAGGLGALRRRRPWGTLKGMLGRKDHSLSLVNFEMGRLEIKARWADTISSRKDINERLDRIDGRHLPPPTD